MEYKYLKGQKACVWVRHNYPRDGRSEYDERNLHEATVLSVGSKYITTDYWQGTKYNADDLIHNEFHLESACGHSGLFPNRELALRYFNKMTKIKEIGNVPLYYLTADSIEAIYAIITNDPNVLDSN